MPYRDSKSSYEASSGPFVNVLALCSRLEDTTPDNAHSPACVVDDAAAPGTGVQVTGTILERIDNTGNGVYDYVVMNIARGAMYYHQIRNVATYAAAVEATWVAIYFGTPIYYDRSATMPASVYLSCSPLDNNGVANPLFGFAWHSQTEEDDPWRTSRTTFPKGTAGVASTQTDVVVMQSGEAGR